MLATFAHNLLHAYQIGCVAGLIGYVAGYVPWVGRRLYPLNSKLARRAPHVAAFL